MLNRSFLCAFMLIFLCGCASFQWRSLKRSPSPERECNKDIKYRMSARYNDHVKVCYEFLLAKNPTAQGTLGVELVIVYGVVVDVKFAKERYKKYKMFYSKIAWYSR